MIVIAIASLKGGVGKTTLSLNLACALARRGWRTLLIDADPQHGIGFSLTRSATLKPGLTEVLPGTQRLAHCLLPTRIPLLSLLPFGQAEALTQIGLLSHQFPARLIELRHQAELLSFDCVIFDTAAGLHDTQESLVKVSDQVLVPLQAEPLAARSLPQMLSTLKRYQDEGARTELLGVILTMVDTQQEASRSVHDEICQLLPSTLLLPYTIPRHPVFLRSSAEGLPVSLLAEPPPAESMVFEQIAGWVEDHTHLNKQRPPVRPYASLLD